MLAARNGMGKKYEQFAKDLLETCVQMYKRMPTGLSAELVYFNQGPSMQEDITVRVSHFFQFGSEICKRYCRLMITALHSESSACPDHCVARFFKAFNISILVQDEWEFCFQFYNLLVRLFIFSFLQF